MQARQALHFLHVAQTLAGMGPNERRFRSAVFGELGRLLRGLRVSFCEMVVVTDLALVHGLARQAHYFERFSSFFVASAVLQRPRQKTEVEAWLNTSFFIFNVHSSWRTLYLVKMKHVLYKLSTEILPRDFL